MGKNEVLKINIVRKTAIILYFLHIFQVSKKLVFSIASVYAITSLRIEMILPFQNKVLKMCMTRCFLCWFVLFGKSAWQTEFIKTRPSN